MSTRACLLVPIALAATLSAHGWSVAAQETQNPELVGRIVTVEMNGTRVICDREIPGITGGALDSDEASPGPVMLQGDHGAVEFRNLVVTPGR